MSKRSIKFYELCGYPADYEDHTSDNDQHDEDYINQPAQYPPDYSRLDNITKQATTTVAALKKYIKQVENGIERRDDISISKAYLLMYSKVSDLAARMREDIDFIFKPPAYQEIKEQVEEVFDKAMTVDFDFTDEGWAHIKIPRLLALKNDKTKAIFHREFIHAVQKAYAKIPREKVRWYKKCFYIFIYHFGPESGKSIYSDNDNYEVKAVQDALSIFLMPDDSAPYCSNIYTSVMDEKEWSEIYVIPFEDLQKYVEKFNYFS